MFFWLAGTKASAMFKASFRKRVARIFFIGHGWTLMDTDQGKIIRGFNALLTGRSGVAVRTVAAGRFRRLAPAGAGWQPALQVGAHV
jgi:hypothetical protein